MKVEPEPLDFRRRYRVPEHFVWDPYDLKAIDYAGYTEVVFGLLPRPPRVVFDVGCGDGGVAEKMIERGYSDRAVAFARLMVPHAEFFVEDVRALSGHAEWRQRFNVAVCIEVIEHVPPERHLDALREIGSCLSEGGSLLMTVPSTHMPVNPWHYKHFSRDEGGELLKDAGLEVRTVVNQHVLTPLSSPILWRLLHNRFYDLRVVRTVLKRILLARYNTTRNPRKAGRFIYHAIKT